MTAMRSEDRLRREAYRSGILAFMVRPQSALGNASQDQSMLNPQSPDISAEAYLARLAERGIEYVFANAGTDFAPIIEALSRNPGSNARSRVHHRAARERRDGDGARLLPRQRQAGGRDGARHGRHRQRDLRPDERRARQRPDAARRRPHAAHRDRPHRLAQPLDPLGPGDVRPGRHGARIRASGTTSCAPASRSTTWSTARSTSR